MKTAALILLCVCLSASAQRGIGTRSLLQSAVMPSLPTVKISWIPDPAATCSVIVSATNILAPLPWTVRAVVTNSVARSVVLPRTNPQEFFRAYSQ
jgi:hypothetical protein